MEDKYYYEKLKIRDEILNNYNYLIIGKELSVDKDKLFDIRLSIEVLREKNGNKFFETIYPINYLKRNKLTIRDLWDIKDYTKGGSFNYNTFVFNFTITFDGYLRINNPIGKQLRKIIVYENTEEELINYEST